MAVARVGAVLFASAASASANFHITGVKTDLGATDVVELYYHNDGVGGTGTALEAYEATYSGTPLRFRYLPGTDGEPGEGDVYNRSNNPDLSWFRVHPNRLFPSHSIPDASSTAWAAPIANFRITYATFELNPLPANTPAGVRFARLVLPDGGQFNLETRVGGEVGPAVDANYLHSVANLPPVISGAGQVITDRLTNVVQTRRVSAIDPDGLLLSFAVQDVDNALAAGFSVAQVNNGAYDISWNPSLVAPGDYRFSLFARDSSIQSNSSSAASLTISVVPEPASTLAVTSLVLLARARRRL